MRVRRSTMAAVAAFGVLGVALMCASAPAFAGLGYAYKAPQLTGPPGGFQQAWGVAVYNTTGDVYVSDPSAGVVDKFNAAGVYVSQLTGPSGGSFVKPEGVAVDQSTGDVYVADPFRNDVVDKFDASGVYLGQLTGPPGGFTSPEYVTVDSSGNVYVADRRMGVDVFNSSGVYQFQMGGGILGSEEPRGVAVDDSTGEVYVVGQGGIYVFSSSGALLATWTGANTPEGSFGTEFGVAVNQSTGDVYVPEFNRGGAPGRGVDVLSHEGVFLARVTGASTPAGSLEPRGVAFAGEDLYVVDHANSVVDIFEPGMTPPAPNTDAASGVTGTAGVLNGDLNPGGVAGGVGFYFEYNLGESCSGQGAIRTPLDNGGPNAMGASDVPEAAEVSGLQPSKLYTFCFVAVNAFGFTAGPPVGLTTSAAAPAVDGESSTGVELTTAVLGAQVNPNNQDTHYYFQYGTDTGYTGGSVPAPPGTDIPSGFGDQPASTSVTGLTASTTYHYRVVAVNATGTTYGADQEFKTLPPPPAVTTGAASGVGVTIASVTGTVNPETLDTHYRYQYGPSAAYGQSTAYPGPDAGAGEEPLPAPIQLEDLLPGTTYHYRLVAESEDGIAYGADETFKTGSYPSPGVETGAAGDVSQTAATVSGAVNAQGQRTTYELQVGTDTSYGADVFGDAGSGDEAQAVTVGLQGLLPGTTYHYRLLASNAGGTSTGADQSFTTPGFPNGIVQPSTPALIVTPALALPPRETSKKPKKPRKSRKTRRKAAKNKGKRRGIKKR